MQYASIEMEIEKEKKAYYNALMNGQKDRGTEQEKINEWLLFFLSTLEQAIRKLENRYSAIKKRKSYLNERQKKLYKYIEVDQPVKISDIISEFEEYTSYTLKKDMRYLGDENLILKMGKGRATIYIINEKNKID